MIGGTVSLVAFPLRESRNREEVKGECDQARKTTCDLALK